MGLRPSPRPSPGCTLVKGVDWMAPKPGRMEGVLTTVGWRGTEAAWDMMGKGRGKGSSSSSSSSSSSRWAGWSSSDWDREEVELTSSKSS